ncbi:MAG: glutamate--tRNA ligase [Methanosarcinales archaeon]|nr:glutamate--tRNA ligase [Methanosarcinales archaeon]
MDIEKLIKKYALQNAVKYGKPPQQGAVMGKLMGEQPELRQKAKEIPPILGKILQEICSKTPEQWQTELEEIAPELIAELEQRKEPDKGLKALPDAEKGVIMRFAPNPNGPPTLGSARGIVVNSEYVKKYNGKFIIRFDDTDPVTKRPMLEAYDWYLEDCRWLGAEPDQVVMASDRLPVYYEYAEQLISGNHAYVCCCSQEDFKQLKDNKQACPHRDVGPEVNMREWKRMLAGEYEERSAVLRIKTDITHKDPAIRDWGAFRIVKTPHPRPEIADKYVVWPLLDFEGALEDHLLAMTHIIRGKDLIDSERRQKYVYDYFGWTYPHTSHWGRVKMHEFGKFSTSGLRSAIEAGEYTGWDDPRLPTLRALRRRGIRPEALRKFFIEMGVGETDVSLSLDNLYAENRKLIDDDANRYFFVWEPVKLELSFAEPAVARPPRHPGVDRGIREIPVEDSVFVCSQDIKDAQPGDIFRLKDLYNIRIIGEGRAEFAGYDIEMMRKGGGRIIHWAPVDNIPVRVLTPDGEMPGIGEVGIADELDRVVQFERYGYARIDSVDDEVIAYFTHK